MSYATPKPSSTKKRRHSTSPKFPDHVEMMVNTFVPPPSPNTDSIRLPTYECQLCDDAVQHSRKKLDEAAASYLAVSSSIKAGLISTLPAKSNEDTLSYRCSCSFQLLAPNELSMDEGEVGVDRGFRWAMRNNYEPVALRTKKFPVALPRIQSGMEALLDVMNDDFSTSRVFTDGLTGGTFSCSWNEEDLIVVLHYGAPICSTQDWTKEMNKVLEKCAFTSILGRSKKRVAVVGREPPTLNDEIIIMGDDDDGENVAVCYEKPEGAFFHPNGNTMHQALNWIQGAFRTISNDIGRKLRLFEMYCGCGAHTCALGMMKGIMEKIVAIEIDQRLVDAAERNIELNGLESMVKVFQDDAARVGRVGGIANYLKKKKLLDDSGGFDILLVDPPRSGLEEVVCSFAEKEVSIEWVVYVSCGKEALVRDLARLETSFSVEKMVLTDLFPRTTSVETLVLLRRRRKSAGEEEKIGGIV